MTNRPCNKQASAV